MPNHENSIDMDEINEDEKEFRAEVELDWEALAVAFENQLPDSHSFLDLRNGSVQTLVTNSPTIPEMPEPEDAHVYIRPRPSREGYRTMQRFVENVQESLLKEKLVGALVGKGAFRRFKDQLLGYPEIRQDWFAFKDAEVYAYIHSWLVREGIKPLNDPPSTTSKDRFPPVPIRLPERRRELFANLDLSSDAGDWKAAIEAYDRPESVFRPPRTALLVIDMQKAFVDPEASTYLPMSSGACERLDALVQACRRTQVPVIFTRHVHVHPEQDGGAMARWWRGLILEGTTESELIDALRPLENERVITKCRYSAFAGTPLEMILHSMGVEDLLIGGVMTNLCCETTARDAFVRDFNVFFLGDGTATADEELHLSTLRNIAYGFGRVLSTTEALQALSFAGVSNVGRVE